MFYLRPSYVGGTHNTNSNQINPMYFNYPFIIALYYTYFPILITCPYCTCVLVCDYVCDYISDLCTHSY
jgi:hypothetical protein